MSTRQTIVSLRAENVKRLSAIEINPDGRPLVCIGGRNGQGKSSVLDAIAYAFSGKGALPEQPIRQGAERSTILVRTQDYVVERRITAKGSTVEVRAADGSKLASPQAILDSLTSAIAFDPVGFLREKPKDQVAALAELAGLDLAAAATKRADLYAERTVANRHAGEHMARALPLHADAPAAEVDAGSLADQVRTAEAKNREREAALRRAETAKAEAAAAKKAVADAEEVLRKARVELDAKAREAGALATAAAALPPAIDTAAMATKAREVEAINRKVRENADRKKAQEQAAGWKAEADRLTAAIDAIDAEQRAALAAAKLPVAGLTFDGDRVLLNGVPLAQASTAEQLRVSVGMALAQRPGLAVALVRDGSLLDAASLATLAEIAGEYGAQCWVERVSDGAEVAVVIEDGAVLDNRLPAAEPEPEPAAPAAALPSNLHPPVSPAAVAADDLF